MTKNPLPESGQRFGRLEVKHLIKKFDGHQNRTYAVCICDCGKEATVKVRYLHTGVTTSCGCFHSEVVSKTFSEINKTHGLSRHELYPTWYAIKRRTSNPDNIDYKYYGARGISMFKPWFDDVSVFIDYIESTLGSRPTGHTIDRIDVNGNYEPGNVRWASHKEQMQNQRRNQK